MGLLWVLVPAQAAECMGLRGAQFHAGLCVLFFLIPSGLGSLDHHQGTNLCLLRDESTTPITENPIEVQDP